MDTKRYFSQSKVHAISVLPLVWAWDYLKDAPLPSSKQTSLPVRILF
jgi:hypothetical protein